MALTRCGMAIHGHGRTALTYSRGPCTEQRLGSHHINKEFDVTVQVLVGVAVLCAALAGVFFAIFKALPYGRATLMGVAAVLTAATGLLAALAATLGAMLT
jgi:hypothetical protein